MTPKIFIYEDARLIITPEAFTIKELRDIIDKYDMNAEPYLMYADKMTHPESAYINQDLDEKKENIIYDIVNTLGDFDIDEPLLDPAIARLDKVYTSKTKKYFDGIGRLIDKVSAYSLTATIDDNKKEGNLDNILKMIKEAGSNIRSYKELEKVVDEELKIKMRGKAKMGRY